MEKVKAREASLLFYESLYHDKAETGFKPKSF